MTPYEEYNPDVDGPDAPEGFSLEEWMQRHVFEESTRWTRG